MDERPPDGDELSRQRERLYQIAEHQHQAGIRLERAVTTLEHYGGQLDRIEQMATLASKRLDDHSEELSDLRGDIRVLQDRATQANRGAVTVAGSLGAAAGGAMAAAYHFLTGGK